MKRNDLKSETKQNISYEEGAIFSLRRTVFNGKNEQYKLRVSFLLADGTNHLQSESSHHPKNKQIYSIVLIVIGRRYDSAKQVSYIVPKK